MSADPARIALAASPLTRRMTGTTAHGLVPFDVPFISEIAPNLWQGGCENGLVLPGFVKHLVSLYQEEQYKVRHPLDSALSVRMHDSLDQDTGHIDAIAAWVNACRAHGPVLVQCQAGLNRSSLVTARALMLGGMTAGEAITLIREKRSPAALCNPAFEARLRDQDAARSALAAPLASLWPGGPRSHGPVATRAYRNLLRAGYATAGAVADRTEGELLGLRSFGAGQLAEVKRVLGEAGLKLREFPT